MIYTHLFILNIFAFCTINGSLHGIYKRGSE